MNEDSDKKVKVTVSPKAMHRAAWALAIAMLLLLVAVMIAYPQQWLPQAVRAYNSLKQSAVTAGIVKISTPTVTTTITPTPTQSPEEAVVSGLRAMSIVDYREPYQNLVDRFCAVSTVPGCEEFTQRFAPNYWKDFVIRYQMVVTDPIITPVRMLLEIPVTNIKGVTIGMGQIWEVNIDFNANSDTCPNCPKSGKGHDFVLIGDYGSGWQYDHLLWDNEVDHYLRDRGLIP
jgi:hypothetical protein